MNEVKEVKDLLVKQEIDINSIDENGDTPLHIAINNFINSKEYNDNFLAIIKNLLTKEGIDVNAKNKSGKTPLRLAIDYIIGLIFNKDIDDDAKNKYNNALMDIIKDLLANETTNVNAKYEENLTLLHLCLYAIPELDPWFFRQKPSHIFKVNLNQLETVFKIIRLLFVRGADITVYDNKLVESPMTLAKTRCLTALFSQDPSKNIRKEISEGRYMLAQILLNEENINVSCNGMTPLHTALENYAPIDFVKFLLDTGANIEAQDEGGNTPILLAMQVYDSSHPVFKCLLEKNPNLHITNKKGDTLLHYAAEINDFGMVKTLVESHNFNIDIKNKSGRTPIYFAIRSHKNDALKYLLEKGANVHNESGNGATLLHIAAEHGDSDVLKYLLEKDSNVNTIDFFGNTPLHVAVSSQFDDLEKVKILIKSYSADVNIKNTDGETTIQRAINFKRPNPDVIKYLLDSGAEISKEDLEHIANFAIDDAKKILPENLLLKKYNEMVNENMEYLKMALNDYIRQLEPQSKASYYMHRFLGGKYNYCESDELELARKLLKIIANKEEFTVDLKEKVELLKKEDRENHELAFCINVYFKNIYSIQQKINSFSHVSNHHTYST